MNKVSCLLNVCVILYMKWVFVEIIFVYMLNEVNIRKFFLMLYRVIEYNLM